MGERFYVYDEHAAGDALYAHRLLEFALPGLGREVLTACSVDGGHRSQERIGTATRSISEGSIVELVGCDLVLAGTTIVVGTNAIDGPARDRLLAEALTRETEALGKGYAPDRHTDFDVEHGWRVTMEMGRGG